MDRPHRPGADSPDGRSSSWPRSWSASTRQWTWAPSWRTPTSGGARRWPARQRPTFDHRPCPARPGATGRPSAGHCRRSGPSPRTAAATSLRPAPEQPARPARAVAGYGCFGFVALPCLCPPASPSRRRASTPPEGGTNVRRAPPDAALVDAGDVARPVGVPGVAASFGAFDADAYVVSATDVPSGWLLSRPRSLTGIDRCSSTYRSPCQALPSCEPDAGHAVGPKTRRTPR